MASAHPEPIEDVPVTRRLARRLLRVVRLPPRGDALALGRRGERAAARALRRTGYRILGRNVRTPPAEIDLVAMEGRVLVVVEVKTTRSGDRLLRRVSRAQRRRLRRAGRWLQRGLGTQVSRVRHDVVTVVMEGPRAGVTHYRNRF